MQAKMKTEYIKVATAASAGPLLAFLIFSETIKTDEAGSPMDAIWNIAGMLQKQNALGARVHRQPQQRSPAAAAALCPAPGSSRLLLPASFLLTHSLEGRDDGPLSLTWETQTGF